MAKINVLPPQVAELIAAGEVIDRPASIAKELVENALDAGGTRITVEIRGGGVSYLRVTDNGCGIERDDLANAFIRHATSKVSCAGDLDAIGTLGFRGEALPSIAAVSHVTVTTRTADSSVGSEFAIDGSSKGVLTDTGCPVGTTVEVRDVFYNTPARMKFLKKDSVEGNAIASLLDRLALANPGVAFELIREGRRTLQTPGDGNLLTAIRIVCGEVVSSQMIPVSHRENGILVEGYISRPATCRSTRTLQSFYINTRYVRSRTCTAAVEDAYKNRLMVGRFPACVLNLTVDTSQVDVNVHPSKLEVRFSSERDVYNAVSVACLDALSRAERRLSAPEKKKLTPFSLDDFDYSDQQTRLSSPLRPFAPSHGASGQAERLEALASLSGLRSSAGQALCSPPPSFESARPEEEKAPAAPAEKTPRQDARPQTPAFPVQRLPLSKIDIEVTEQSRRPAAAAPAPTTAPPGEKEASPAEKTPLRPENPLLFERVAPPPDTPVCEEEAPAWRVIGELFSTYILVEQGDEYHMIDKHAAHERYNYERLRHLGEDPADRQVLLSPEAVTLPREEYFALLEHPEVLEAIGVTAEDFGDGTLLVREIPMLLSGCSLLDLLEEAAGKVIGNRRSITPELIDELLYSVACRASVMAGKRSTAPELSVLADFVLGERQIRFCPHGRPAVVTLTKRDVEKMFGRLG